jgi:hypothetical protein
LAELGHVRSDDIHRGSTPRHPRLELTLFSRATGGERRGDIDSLMHELEEVADALERAERKLAAIEALEGIDAAAIRAATTHVRFLCRTTGYGFAELDDPPPAPGELLEVDDELFVVDRLRPSPFPGDPRRCAVLVSVDVADETTEEPGDD